MPRQSVRIADEAPGDSREATLAILARNPARATRSARRASEPTGDAPPPASAQEERLLTLRRQVAVTPPFADVRSVTGSRTAVEARRHRAYLPIAFWSGLALLVALTAAASYLTARSGDGASGDVSASTPFRVESEGSGRVAIPAGQGEAVVRVGVQSVSSAAGAWFWCIESDQPLTLAQHQCKSAGVRGADGYISAEAGIVGRGAGADGAKYYVQMYCQSSCRWRVEVDEALSPLAR